MEPFLFLGGILTVSLLGLLYSLRAQDRAAAARRTRRRREERDGYLPPLPPQPAPPEPPVDKQFEIVSSRMNQTVFIGFLAAGSLPSVPLIVTVGSHAEFLAAAGATANATTVLSLSVQAFFLGGGDIRGLDSFPEALTLQIVAVPAAYSTSDLISYMDAQLALGADGLHVPDDRFTANVAGELLVAPGLSGATGALALNQALLRLSNRMGGALLLMDAGANDPLSAVLGKLSAGTVFPTASAAGSQAALYFPWVQITGGASGGAAYYPPSPFVARTILGHLSASMVSDNALVGPVFPLSTAVAALAYSGFAPVSVGPAINLVALGGLPGGPRPYLVAFGGRPVTATTMTATAPLLYTPRVATYLRESIASAASFSWLWTADPPLPSARDGWAGVRSEIGAFLQQLSQDRTIGPQFGVSITDMNNAPESTVINADISYTPFDISAAVPPVLMRVAIDLAGQRVTVV